MATFRPEPRINVKNVRHITYTCGPDRYTQLSAVADKAGISLKELLRQMVNFSLENMDQPDD